MKDKRILYKRIIILANVCGGVAIVLLLIHLSAPLFGGKLLLGAIPLYGVWIVCALLMRSGAKRRLLEDQALD
jgi:hypothetical protein